MWTPDDIRLISYESCLLDHVRAQIWRASFVTEESFWSRFHKSEKLGPNLSRTTSCVFASSLVSLSKACNRGGWRRKLLYHLCGRLQQLVKEEYYTYLVNIFLNKWWFSHFADSDSVCSNPANLITAVSSSVKCQPVQCVVQMDSTAKRTHCRLYTHARQHRRRLCHATAHPTHVSATAAWATGPLDPLTTSSTPLYFSVAPIRSCPVCPAVCIHLRRTTGAGPVQSSQFAAAGWIGPLCLHSPSMSMFYLCGRTFLFSLKTDFQILYLNLVWWKIKTFSPFHIFSRIPKLLTVACLCILSEFSCFCFFCFFSPCLLWLKQTMQTVDCHHSLWVFFFLRYDARHSAEAKGQSDRIQLPIVSPLSFLPQPPLVRSPSIWL